MIGHGQIEGFTEKYGMEFQRAQRDEAIERGAGRTLGAGDRAAPPRPLAVRGRRRLPPVRRDDRRRRRPRRRLRLLERARPRPVAGRLPQPVRVGRGLDPDVGAVRASRPRTGRSPLLAPRWARRSRCRVVATRSSRSGTPAPGSSSCDPPASSASAGCSSSWTPTAAWSSAVFGRSATRAGRRGRSWRRSWAGAACPRSTMRWPTCACARSTTALRPLLSPATRPRRRSGSSRSCRT